MVQIHPKQPTGYQDYLIVKRNYILASNAPAMHMPLRLPAELRVPGCEHLAALFRDQEMERRVQALKHQSEREQLILSAEQAVIHAHTRAALALASQPRPLSFCSVYALENLTFIPPVKFYERVSYILLISISIS
ncbi:Ankyrin repeat domain-containing protein 11 [Cichlidogyrus casuarinus]|uniref:Ankyrin repeat domain-containing protein 11 n=1 Tax=Cichlidogyrus casuarinus TaxID=1844966 RepID=A0ABD2PK30_9PLAT